MKEEYRETWIHPSIEIKESPLGGKGMFATTDIAQGEKVVVWGGKYTDSEGAEQARQAGMLVMHLDDDLYSIETRGEDESYFMNHSCDPNTWVTDAFTLETRRKVANGDELTADYAMWEGEDYVSSWECKCGSALCRHRITGQDWKLKDLQERYKGHFSPLINKFIKSS